MIRIKNIRLGLAGALIVPVALALVACSPIYADDPNEVKEGIFSPEVELEALNEKIQSAVESGAISQDQVDAVIEIFKSGISESRNPHHKKPFVAPEEIKAKIAAAVESGELTQEEADKKLATLEERIEKGQRWHGKGNPHHKKPFVAPDEIKAKIAAAVESGELTQEEADKKLATLEERIEKGQRWHGKGKPHHKKSFVAPEEIKAKIAAAVENGELSAEEAKNKLLYIDGKLKKATYY